MPALSTLLLSLSVGGYIAIGALLVCQWALAIVALMRLFEDKIPAPWCITWNVFIVLCVLIGPITYIIVSKTRRKKQKH